MKKKVFSGLIFMSAVATLVACSDDSTKEHTHEPQKEVVEVTQEEKTTIGFVTFIEDGEYVEIEVDGVYLQYAVDTTDIQIGNRVEVTFDGKIEDKKIKNISIDRKAVAELENEGSDGVENKKNVIYLDKNGNVIQDLEDFKENIKKRKEEEEAARLAEIEALNKQNQELINGEQENVPPAEETPIPSEEPKDVTTIEIMYYGKADARTIEVMHDGTMKAMYLNSDEVAKQFDSIELEKQLNVEAFVDDSGNYVINSIK